MNAARPTGIVAVVPEAAMEQILYGRKIIVLLFVR